MVIITKKNNYIYLHHKGQFFHKNPPSKIQLGIGQKIFVNINHDLTQLIEIYNENGEQNCYNQNNDDLDGCIIRVSTNKLLHFFMTIRFDNFL